MVAREVDDRRGHPVGIVDRAEPLEQRVNALPKRIARPQTWRQWLTERVLFFGCATVLCLLIVLMVAGAMAIISELRR